MVCLLPLALLLSAVGGLGVSAAFADATPCFAAEALGVTSIDTLVDEWQLALDGAAAALEAAAQSLPPDELRARRQALAFERAETAHELAALARDIGSRDVPWLSPTRILPRALGLPDGVQACIFDLDGVLTDSGVLHAAAWAEVFDEFLQRRGDEHDWHFAPFDRDADYRAFFDGRTRLEGIHLFLRSRGIAPTEEVAAGLARRKADALGRRLRRRGISALPGARRYLEAAGHAGLARGVVSSSTRTLPMLELAGLAPLVDARVDAEQIARGELRSRPAPDLLLRACELLGVAPERAASFVHNPDGVAAGRNAGLIVIGVADDEHARERLHGFGSDVVVARLGELLDRRLLAAA
jgi:beta-phosphoglucomutase-like phosphatase (HAD superfamily)